ncbi:MAG: LysM peptidoglycan-binding domain-containing protein, partial [Flavobacteriales bacterium]
MRIVGLLVFLLIFLGQMFSQTGELQTSDNVQWTNHTVEAGQTLYAISKLYGVTVESIKGDNPGAESGIRVGQILRIRKPQTALSNSERDTVFIAHVVKEGETLYGLAQQYKTTVEAITNANHGLPSGLILGDTIMVPKTTADQEDQM